MQNTDSSESDDVELTPMPILKEAPWEFPVSYITAGNRELVPDQLVVDTDGDGKLTVTYRHWTKSYPISYNNEIGCYEIVTTNCHGEAFWRSVPMPDYFNPDIKSKTPPESIEWHDIYGVTTKNPLTWKLADLHPDHNLSSLRSCWNPTSVKKYLAKKESNGPVSMFDLSKPIKNMIEDFLDVSMFVNSTFNLAAAEGHLKVFKHMEKQQVMKKTLVKYNPRKNSVKNTLYDSDAGGWSPYPVAGRFGQLEIIKYLEIKGNFDPFKLDARRCSLITGAVDHGHMHVLEYLDKYHKIDWTIEVGNGFSSLTRAARNNQVEVLKWLISKPGINLNDPDSNGATPLVEAAFGGRLNVIKYLEEKGIDLNEPTKHGVNAITSACRKGHLDCVKYFDEKGVDLKAQDGIRETPLTAAIRFGQLETMTYLLEKDGITLDFITGHGNTPATLAAGYGRANVLRFLKEQGIDLNVSDEVGYNPITQAATKGKIESVRCLIEECGIDPRSTNARGKQAMWYAVRDEHERVKSYLENVLKEIPEIGKCDIIFPSNIGKKKYWHSSGESAAFGTIKIMDLVLISCCMYETFKGSLLPYNRLGRNWRMEESLKSYREIIQKMDMWNPTTSGRSESNLNLIVPFERTKKVSEVIMSDQENSQGASSSDDAAMAEEGSPVLAEGTIDFDQYLSSKELDPHQIEGATWLVKMYQEMDAGGVLIADDPGLGKTLMTLSFLAWHRKNIQNPGPILIVAPSNLLPTWEREIVQSVDCTIFGMKWNVYNHFRLSEQDLGKLDLVIVSYELFRARAIFRKPKWAIYVFDEAQRYKNRNSEISKFLMGKKLSHGFRIGLTGTPVENALSDIITIFRCLQTSKWVDDLLPAVDNASKEEDCPDDHAFTDGVDDRLSVGNVSVVEEESTNEEFEPGFVDERAKMVKEKLRDFVLQRNKDLLVGLPKLIPHQPCVDITEAPSQKALYDLYVEGLPAEESSAEESSAGDKQAQNQTTKKFQNLQRILSHPCTADPVKGNKSYPLAIYDDDGKPLSAKLMVLFDILATILNQKRRILVFVQFLKTKDMLKTLCQEKFPALQSQEDFSPIIEYHGELNPDEKIKAEEDFEKDDRVRMMICQIDACAVGLNLQAASCVVHFEVHFNPAKMDQATCRAWRKGQQRDVDVYFLYAEGTVDTEDDYTTVDDRKKKIVERKNQLINFMKFYDEDPNPDAVAQMRLDRENIFELDGEEDEEGAEGSDDFGRADRHPLLERFHSERNKFPRKRPSSGKYLNPQEDIYWQHNIVDKSKDPYPGFESAGQGGLGASSMSSSQKKIGIAPPNEYRHRPLLWGSLQGREQGGQDKIVPLYFDGKKRGRLFIPTDKLQWFEFGSQDSVLIKIGNEDNSICKFPIFCPTSGRSAKDQNVGLLDLSYSMRQGKSDVLKYLQILVCKPSETDNYMISKSKLDGYFPILELPQDSDYEEHPAKPNHPKYGPLGSNDLGIGFSRNYIMDCAKILTPRNFHEDLWIIMLDDSIRGWYCNVLADDRCDVHVNAEPVKDHCRSLGVPFARVIEYLQEQSWQTSDASGFSMIGFPRYSPTRLHEGRGFQSNYAYKMWFLNL
eukprot:gene72-350_t